MRHPAACRQPAGHAVLSSRHRPPCAPLSRVSLCSPPPRAFAGLVRAPAGAARHAPDHCGADSGGPGGGGDRAHPFEHLPREGGGAARRWAPDAGGGEAGAGPRWADAAGSGASGLGGLVLHPRTRQGLRPAPGCRLALHLSPRAPGGCRPMLPAAGCLPFLRVRSALAPAARRAHAWPPAVHVAEEALSWVSISILVGRRDAPQPVARWRSWRATICLLIENPSCALSATRHGAGAEQGGLASVAPNGCAHRRSSLWSSWSPSWRCLGTRTSHAAGVRGPGAGWLARGAPAQAAAAGRRVCCGRCAAAGPAPQAPTPPGML